ncbi:MAG: hypothetical protein CMJ19_07880 [Phycisphaeraceae bacterium]|nr:hypothetical protein [Phycisphaeraceae bacterium]
MNTTPQQPSSDDNNNHLIRGQIRHNQLSARIPESVSRGVFSTGAIVLMGNTEFILDFVLRMQRPHQVVQRVVLPHAVLPQMIGTLEKNLEKYQERFGMLPTMPKPREQNQDDAGEGDKPQTLQGMPEVKPLQPVKNEDDQPQAESSTNPHLDTGEGEGSGEATGQTALPDQVTPAADAGNDAPDQPAASPFAGGSNDDEITPPTSSAPQEPVKPKIVNHPSIEDIYDDLKTPEDGLIAAYANAVMISHSAAEFNLDFICNFFPRSVVTARVFISAPQVVRMLEAVKNTYDEFQKRIIANRRQQIQQLNQQHDMPDYDPKNPYYKPPEEDSDQNETDEGN